MTPEGGGERISWWRAIATGLGVLVVGLVLAVGGVNYVLTDVTSLSRDNRQYVATLVFFAIVIGLAFALRRLQRRGLI